MSSYYSPELSSPSESNRRQRGLPKVFQCRVAVVGLPASQLISSDGGCRAEGVGKSALCSRFTHPGADDYSRFGEDHNSVMSYTDFQESVVNGDHFLYYGKAKRPVGNDGSEVCFELVEQTELVNDFDQTPFNQRCRQIAPYTERAATVRLRSLSKTVYRCRSVMQEPADEGSTSGIDLKIDAFAFILDLSQSPVNIERQIAVLKEIAKAETVRKHPCCLMLSKCDALEDKDLHSASRRLFSYGRKVRPKRPLRTFHTSARRALGIEEAFLYLASQVPLNKAMKRSGTFSRRLNYGQLVRVSQKIHYQAEKDFSASIRSYVVNPETEWSEIPAQVQSSFQRLSFLQGELAARKLFSKRIVMLKTEQLVLESLMNDVDGDVDCEWITGELVERLLKFVEMHPDTASFQQDFGPSELEAKITVEQRRLQPKRSRTSRRRRSSSISKFICVGLPVEETDMEPLIMQ